MRYIFLFLLLGNGVLGLQAQQSDKDFVLTESIYDENYNSIHGEPERKIAQHLNGKSLTDLVNANWISREDMLGLALPLGVYKNNNTIDFKQGMLQMWAAKAAWMSRRKKVMNSAIFNTALNAVAVQLEDGPKLNLRSYRAQLIQPACKQLLGWHQKLRSKYSPARKDFMDIITENLSPNVLIGYNIQELIPPTHMLEDKKTIKKINPFFKAYYLDRLLQEAGADFVAYFPARYDAVHSFGPFQFTPIALEDIQTNGRISNDFKKYKQMDELKSLNDHVVLATIFAYNNWERISMLLKRDGTLEKFNTYFKDASTNEDKRRRLRIFIAGMTACMHHHPPQSWKLMRNYLKSSSDLSNLHCEAISNFGGSQLKKYYRSAAEAYLIMKIYHKLTNN